MGLGLRESSFEPVTTDVAKERELEPRLVGVILVVPRKGLDTYCIIPLTLVFFRI